MFPRLITLALLLWGIAAPCPIFAVPDTRIESAAANRYADHCEIAYRPEWMASLSGEQQQSVIIHEVGHCLMLNHLPPGQDGVMSGTFAGRPFSGYDRAEFWRHYPAPYRLFVAY